MLRRPMAELDLNDLAVFVRVVARSGFAKAARELRVPTSTVSRAVARLEKHTGARLLHRTTRTVYPTSEGEKLFANVAPAVGQLQGVVRATSLRGPKPHGRLRVTAPNDLGNTIVADVAVAFAERYPEVELELELTARRVDIVAEGFDVALRAGPLGDSSLVARRVGDLEQFMFASPSYIQRSGLPTSVEDLARHPCILFRARGGEAIWNLRGPDGHEQVLRVKGRVGGDDFQFVRSAVLAGGGIALMPAVLCAPDLASSRLVRILPEYEGPSGTLHFVHPFSRQVPPKVTAFRDAIMQAFAERRGRI